MKYFINIEILYEKFFFVISKYCPVSNSNVNTIVTDINNVESSTDSDSSNKVYNVNNNNNSNNVVYNSNLMFHKLQTSGLPFHHNTSPLVVLLN